MKKIYLSSPHLSDNNSELKYIKQALEERQMFPFGENVIELENKLESYLGNGNNKVVALNSGTAAISLALILAGVSYGDEVLCQSMTFSASANPIIYQGAKPIFIDSEQNTWNMCPVTLEEAIKSRINEAKKPKAIIVVHLYGMAADMDEISAISKKYEITLIEDAAEGLGSIYKGQKCGTFGDFGILSFNSNKIITTSGGGALICKNEEDKQKAIFLATQACNKAPHYQHTEIGYNYRMSNILAGIGRGQMGVLDKHIGLRRRNHQFYQELFKDVNGITVFTEPNLNYLSNHWLSCIIINKKKTGFSREDVRLQLEEDNIESRPLWKPMHLQPVFKDCKYYGNNIAEELFNKGLCLPSGSNLDESDLQRISESINKLL